MLCLCGEPLHYPKSSHYRFIADQVLKLGADFALRPLKGQGYWVPRHYFALHPFQVWELGELAERYGWRPVTDRYLAHDGPRRPKARPRDPEDYRR